MIIFPEAKINLGLRIVRKRPDGYHDLETCFTKIPLCDALEVLPSDRLLWEDDPDVPEDNLVIKAYRALHAVRGTDLPPVQILLRKRIPSGAGLGGGSSDAISAIRLFNELLTDKLTDEELREIARSLGADCPFFLKDTPQYAEGIGDLLEPIELPIKGMRLTLVFPELFISTKEAFAGVTPREPSEHLKETLKRPISEWKEHLKNDFEESLFPKYPELPRIKDLLYDAGATYASMSGSGSTMFALSVLELSLPKSYNIRHFRFE